MIELETGLPQNVVVAVAQGRVDASDYEEVLLPAIERATAGGRKARLVYVLGEAFQGFAAGAALDDARVGLRHWADFELIGLVTDHEAYRLLVRGFGFLMPGEVRVFDLSDLDEARRWVTS